MSATAWVAGVGEVAHGSGKRRPDTLALAIAAARRALDDAGLHPHDVDGILAYGLYGDLVPAEAVGYGLGCRTVRAAFDYAMGGQAPATLTGLASQLVHARKSEIVVIVRSLRSISIGRAITPRIDGSLRLAAGLSAYPVSAALWARSYLAAANLDDVALAQALLHAARNVWKPDVAGILPPPEDFGAKPAPRSIVEYLESPFIASPLRRADCVTEVDGAAAVVVVSDAVAASISQPGVGIAGWVWRSTDADVDMSSMLGYPDLSRNVSWSLREALVDELGLDPTTADVISIYDCFSSVLLQSIEGLGLCAFGGAPQYLADLANDGSAGPLINPGGGMLSRGYLHGMTNLVDAVRATRALRQSGTNPTTIVLSGGMTSGSAVVLEA